MKKTGILIVLTFIILLRIVAQTNVKSENYIDGMVSRIKLTGLTDKSIEAKLNDQLKTFGNGKTITEKNGAKYIQEDEAYVEYLKNNILTYSVSSGYFQARGNSTESKNAIRMKWNAYSACKNLRTGNDLAFNEIFKKETHTRMLQLVKVKLKETYAGTRCSTHVFTDEEINKIIENPCVYDEGIRFQTFACDTDKNNLALFEVFLSNKECEAFIDPNGILFK